MPADVIRTVFYLLGYAFVLIAGLVVVNILLTRLTREERDAERRRRQRKTP